MAGNKAIYFASDFHLGSKFLPDSRQREKIIVSWLDYIKSDACELFLLGDIFDYWFEYKEAVPKGFIRLQGKLAELADVGIQIHFFTGNHDLWVKDYFTQEFGAKIYHNPQTISRNGKILHIGHGDGLGPGDTKYKIIKGILSNKICQSAFSLIHPTLGLKIMKYASHSSRVNDQEVTVIDPFKERQIIYCNDHHRLHPDTDCYIFGHRHVPLIHPLSSGKAVYYNLGEWWTKYTYLKINEQILLMEWKE
jgi:UDP-2,3-diacylglucosamine hydrolase